MRHLEVEGYVILPYRLETSHIAELKKQCAQFDTTHVDYSIYQRGKSAIQFSGGSITELIAFPPTIQFLETLCGDVVAMSYDYARSEPRHPGISLHCDGQPWGSKIFGAEYTCPKLLRVLYYLDDLTPEISPFRVVPRSHLSFHNQANPYLRYQEHPEEVMVTCPAGSILIFNSNVFHGNYPNNGSYARDSLQLSYRPTWAGPIEAIEPWNPVEISKLSVELRRLMGDRSGRIWIPEGGNKPPDMPDTASGINPSRWEVT